jgi:hypothetical protein
MPYPLRDPQWQLTSFILMCVAAGAWGVCTQTREYTLVHMHMNMGVHMYLTQLAHTTI